MRKRTIIVLAACSRAAPDEADYGGGPSGRATMEKLSSAVSLLLFGPLGETY